MNTGGAFESLESRTLFSITDFDLPYGADGLAVLPFKADTVLPLGNGDVILYSGSTKAGDGSPIEQFAEFDAQGAMLWKTSTTTQPQFSALTLDAAASLPDGKVIVATRSSYLGQPEAQIRRLNTDGTTDSTFAGTFSTDSPFGNVINDILPQADGSALLCGTTGGSATAVIATHIDASGSIVNGFNFHFLTRADSSRGTAIVTQNDGKIVVVGTVRYRARTRIALCRFNADGTIDSTYGTNGTFLTNERLTPAVVRYRSSDDDVLIAANPSAAQAAAGASCEIIAANNTGAFDQNFSVFGFDISPTFLDHISDFQLDTNGNLELAGVTDHQPVLGSADPNGNFQRNYIGTNEAIGGPSTTPVMAITTDNKLLTYPSTLRLRQSLGFTTPDLNTFPTDTDAPVVVLNPLRRISPNTFSTTYQIKVTFADDASGVDPQTLVSGTVIMTYGRNRRAYATYTGTTSSGTHEITAIYTLPAPGGTWGREDAGTYTLHLVSGEVTDQAGNATPDTLLGTFVIPPAQAT